MMRQNTLEEKSSSFSHVFSFSEPGAEVQQYPPCKLGIIKNLCKFAKECHLYSAESFLCNAGGGVYCGNYRTLESTQWRTENYVIA